MPTSNIYSSSNNTEDPLLLVRKLNAWVLENGWKGWDPYDIKENSFVLKITRKSQHNLFFRIFREIIFECFQHYPLYFRKLLGTEPRINAKAMGLFALGYLNLYELTRSEDFYTSAMDCLNWLKKNKAPDIVGSGWGYPFQWQSNQLIPAGTPNGIVSTAVGEAFWKAYGLLGEESSLNECINISHFLASLPKHETGDESLCFSYTPLYINHVHNLNLFIAEFLVKTGKEIHHQEWVELGNKALNYTLACQKEDGSFDYNGPPEKPANFIDHYHTGFVLRMLYSLWKLTGRTDVEEAFTRCFSHYKNNFFAANGAPKLLPHRKYRIDIHSCSEAILCLSVLKEHFPEAEMLANRVFVWTIDHMMDKNKGYFYYAIHKSRFTGIPFTSKIPYLRWGQAWMMLALSTYLKNQVDA